MANERIAKTDQSKRAGPSAEETQDFRLLLALFVTFRLASVLFLRPGGYVRDYTDLIIYLQRASWQEYGLLPFRDYWSEYPPVFPWLSVAIDSVSRLLPVWEDERFWFAALFGVVMVAAETITFVCIYILARHMQPREALRTAWLYAGLFLPVYLLGGWFDGLAVMTIFVALALLMRRRTMANALLFGFLAGLGGLIKIVPLAVLAVAPLAYAHWRERIVAMVSAMLTFVAGYALMYAIGPEMTAASIRILLQRSGWSTIYALISGFNRLGKIVGDPFDPAADITLFEPMIPHVWVLVFFVSIGLALLIAQWRRQQPPQSARSLVTFGGMTYALLLLAYPAWNPQYALYLLPFTVLILPNGRGLFYALALSALVLWEHPVHFNMVDTGYAEAVKWLIDVDYRQLLAPIVLTRTLVLLAVALDFGLTLFQRPHRQRWLPVAVTAVALVIAVMTLPRYGQAYSAARLATSDLRPLVFYLNSQPGKTNIVTQQMNLSRELRPFLEGGTQITAVGGRPDRIDPLPEIVEQGSFIYLQTSDDGQNVLGYLNREQICPERRRYEEWTLWFCNGHAQTEIAAFDDGMILENAELPERLDADNRVVLFWRAREAVARDYTAFVHLLDANGNMVGQWDQPPGGEMKPTSTWGADTVVFDDYRIPAALRGEPPYRLVVGLYDPKTGERQHVAESNYPGGDDFIEMQRYPSR